jgi:pyruvate,water dikinase
VPPGLCVTTSIFWQFLETNNLKSRLAQLADSARRQPDVKDHYAQLSELRAAIVATTMPDEIVKELRAALAQLPAARFAVRSSATSEDLEAASFAGQYDTFLNVTTVDDIIEKIKCCFASYWNERAFFYRAQKGIDHFAHGMAVVVQQLIEAESAGVLFSLNPLSGNEREMVIESCWGLGEALVSGQVSPDRYLIDPFENRLLEQQCGNKAIKLISDGGAGVREIMLDKQAAQEPTLNEAAALELAALAINAQSYYGYPIDIEWARAQDKFYILQARPLTAFSFAPELGQWTSANFREVMPGLVNPLSFTLSLRYDYGTALAEFLTRLGMLKENVDVEWSKRFFGRAYWNVDIVKRSNAKIPGYCERSFDITVGIEPDYQGDGARTPFTLPIILRAAPIFLKLQSLYRNFWREAASYEKEFAGIDAELTALDCAALDDAALIERTRAMIALHYRTNRIALICSFLATESQSDFRQYVDKVNINLSDDEKISVANLLTGLTNLSTAEPLVELWRLADATRAQPQLVELIAATETMDLIMACERTSAGREFAARLQAYLQRFSFLAANDEDLSCPRWADDASFPLGILKNFVQGESSEDPGKAMARQQQCREEEQKRALARVGYLKRVSFLGKLRLVTRYCRWREITRISLSKTYYHCQRVFNEQGRRLVKRGLLATAEDIYWLEREELIDLLDNKLSARQARQRIERAKLIAQCYRNFNPPASIGKGGAAPAIVAQADGCLYSGVACSAGEVVARARVIRSLAEASKLARGEVLIAPHTNPGWTPLFSLAAAVVLEEGGLLSHGAVVARECGIPTVLQIKGATEIFRDGQLLRVDGTRGKVEIMPE